MNAPMTKRCNRCNKPFPLAEYSLNKTGKDGHRRECKSCQKAMVGSARLRKRKEKREAIAEDRGKRREEMKARLASMGLSQD